MKRTAFRPLATALTAAIQWLVNDRQKARRMGQAARNRLIQHFNLEQSIDRHVNLFAGLGEA